MDLPKIWIQLWYFFPGCIWRISWVRQERQQCLGAPSRDQIHQLGLRYHHRYYRSIER
jgi:hypothetical protein